MIWTPYVLVIRINDFMIWIPNVIVAIAVKTQIRRNVDRSVGIKSCVAKVLNAPTALDVIVEIYCMRIYNMKKYRVNRVFY